MKHVIKHENEDQGNMQLITFLLCVLRSGEIDQL